VGDVGDIFRLVRPYVGGAGAAGSAPALVSVEEWAVTWGETNAVLSRRTTPRLLKKYVTENELLIVSNASPAWSAGYHWLVYHVQVSTQTVTAWNSMGAAERADKHVRHVLYNTFNTEFKLVHGPLRHPHGAQHHATPHWLLPSRLVPFGAHGWPPDGRAVPLAAASCARREVARAAGSAAATGCA
jgi:hypothetical protein